MEKEPKPNPKKFSTPGTPAMNRQGAADRRRLRRITAAPCPFGSASVADSWARAWPSYLASCSPSRFGKTSGNAWGSKKRSLGGLWGLRGCLFGRLRAFLTCLTPSEAVLGASLNRLGALLGRFRAVLEVIFCVLEASWAVLGPSWGASGPSWRPCWASWKPLGPSWGPLGAVLGASWAVMGPSWSPLGRSWGRLGGLLRRLEPSEDREEGNAQILQKPKDNQ